MSETKSKFLLPGIVVSMLIWGLGWPSTKIITNFGSPLHIAIIRFAITSCTLFCILYLFKIKFSVAKAGYSYLALASILMAVYTILFLVGIKKGTPGAGGVLVTTLTPIISYSLSILLAKRKPTSNETIGILLGFIAACFLLHVWQNFSTIATSGNIFFLLACITWAILSRITSHAQKFGSPLTFSFWMYIACFVILFPFAQYHELLALAKETNHIYLLNLFFSSVINAGLATTFYFYATSQYGAAKTSSFIYIVPFAAAFFSWLILKEAIHWNTIVGGLLGIAAVYVFNKRKI